MNDVRPDSATFGHLPIGGVKEMQPSAFLVYPDAFDFRRVSCAKGSVQKPARQLDQTSNIELNPGKDLQAEGKSVQALLFSGAHPRVRHPTVRERSIVMVRKVNQLGHGGRVARWNLSRQPSF